MLRIPEIKLSIVEDMDLLPKKIIKKLHIKDNELLSYEIYKESIDARKGEIQFIYTLDVAVADEEIVMQKNPHIIKTPDEEYICAAKGKEKIKGRPVIAGFGPSGMMAALLLCEMGYKPLVIERGKPVEERIKDVERFWSEGKLDSESNVQYGEGGAGTFSDGKLTTRIKDTVRCRKVLEAFIDAGAPEEIMYKQKPHIGTDILQKVVKSIRSKILDLGGEIYFNSKLTDIIIDDNQISAVEINNDETVASNCLVLALGHSARDTFEKLYEKNIKIEQKAFSIGVRIEHPQSFIDKVQYGSYAGHPRLGASDYKLVHHCKNGRGVYSFCMCPGGLVVASASEKNGVVTNGMSYYKRDEENANSALLVDVKPSDFNSDHPLAGIEFQRYWEKRAWESGNSSYYAPAQKVGDFLMGIPSTKEGSVKATYKPGVVWTDLRSCLPEFAADALKEAIPDMAKKIKGFDMEDAVMTAVETRSSSPIRITRDGSMESNIIGIFPVGEGAGYAGGIISAAVDGIKAAEMIAARFSPK